MSSYFHPEHGWTGMPTEEDFHREEQRLLADLQKLRASVPDHIKSTSLVNASVIELAERVAVLEKALILRKRCDHCGGEGIVTGVDPIGMLRCRNCMHRWWQGGGAR